MTRCAEEGKGLRRRELVLGLGLVGLGVGWQILGVREPEISFQEIRGAPGWFFGSAGAVSGLSGNDLMTVGLETGAKSLAASRLGAVVHKSGDAGVPVAVFGDYFCPYCRVLISRLTSWGPGLAISWHELPLLGPGSELVARAAEAASLQAGYIAFYDQLQQEGFRPSEAYMGDVAARAGLDGARLVADMGDGLVQQRLGESASAAATLGLYATPGLVIGQKAVLGAIERRAMERLIEEVAG